MAKEGGLPEKVIKELGVEPQKEPPIEVTIIVEKHQVKIPIPPKIRHELNPKKGQKCKLIYNQETKELICKF